MTWFGNLDLAYKYTIVFLSLLVFTIAAGVIKVLYDRRQLKNFTKNQENVEAGKRDEQMELNQREKDEGDLFGIRAIEAGFYAGIPQSRPGSSAGSIVGAPSMSSNTLIGSLASPKIQSHSVSSSVTSLPLAHTADRARDSQTLPTSNSPPRRKSPPTIKLRPSEAEMNGRINHSASVNMNLMVPPSPVLARPPQSPHFAGSDDESSDGNASPRSLSPHSANFKPDHYSPVPPQTPMHEGLRASVHHPEVTAKSQAASFNESSPGHSPGHSAPPSPGHTSETNVPTMPAKVYREEPRSLFPAYSDRRDSLPRNSAGQAGAGQASSPQKT
ncbi:uncharacterized protein BDR25DRAFT_82666 [Lindgomyces ingoldianus]|uniref:Uncharacterized protein n=1 Tax=Lindgomyces ingoldianus TaxID=673940 RepID=A0ACB6QFR0_9PLEO|nr:uncharacterized protein BDR25DRAFT_82666 [Lindgomyces ingoldianus]KAF2465737.1 hypothetical protein BDR25DRAFT_82666 [Lindgomyces ingoldianus]